MYALVGEVSFCQESMLGLSGLEPPCGSEGINQLNGVLHYMKTKKPDIFLGATMCMLVLAVVLCIVILYYQKSKSSSETTEPSKVETTEGTQASGDTSSTRPSNDVPVTTEAVVTPVNLTPIDDSGLKAALDDSLRGLTSEWQVMVIDPAFDTKISSAVNCEVDDWMTANRMTQIFIMGTVFQQDAEGKLVLNDVLDDVKAMITANDSYAADRLTEKIGGGDAEKGREAVKEFAVANGVQLGFNRANSASEGKSNYVTAQQTAEILNLICSGKLVNESASAQMLDILLTPMENLEIQTDLPADQVRFGFIADVEDDICVCAMGVVKLPNRSFVISIVCNKPVTLDGAKKKLTELITLTAPYFDK